MAIQKDIHIENGSGPACIGTWLALRRLKLLVAIALVFVAVKVPAQVGIATASVVGTVTDTTGAVVPGAQITVTSLSTNVSYTGVSDSAGAFVVPDLRVGSYKITAAESNFSTWSIPQVELIAGQIFRVSPSLRLGAVSQTVTVTSTEVAALQTDSGTVSDVVTPAQWQNMPMLGRNFITLATVAPGNSVYAGAQGESFAGDTSDDRRRTTNLTINDRSGSENNFMLDDLDDNERFVDTIIVKPSMEGVAEMNVVENANSAALGRAAGSSVILVTKGGTNQIHGSAFDYIRNSYTDANPPNLVPGEVVPPYKQNNWGGSIGGPIKRDKIFYFGDFEAYQSDQGEVQLSNVPTLAERSGDFSASYFNTIYDPSTLTTVNGVSTRETFAQEYGNGNKIPASRINSVSQTIANLWPLPNVPGANLVNNFEYSAGEIQNDYTLDTRGDFRVSAKDTGFVRFNWDHVGTTIPNVLPPVNGYDVVGGSLNSVGVGESGPITQQIYSGEIHDTYDFSPSTILTAAIGFNKYANHSLPSGWGIDYADQLGLPGVDTDIYASGFPDIGITGYTSLGTGEYAPTINTNDVFTGAFLLDLQKGKHLLNFGFMPTKRYDQDYQSVEARINWQFTPDYTDNPEATTGTGDGFASFLLGYPLTTLRNRFLILPTYISVELSSWAQDNYRVTPSLTLNLGVRWDFYGPLSEGQGRIANFDPQTATLNPPGVGGFGDTVGVPNRLRDWSPHFGFADQINGGTVLRGGFGINYTPTMTGTAGAFRNPPHADSWEDTPTILQPGNSINSPIPPLVGIPLNNLAGSIYAVALNYKTQYVEQFNLAVDRMLPGGLTFTNAFVGELGRDQSGTNHDVQIDGVAPGPGAVAPRRAYYSELPNVTSISQVLNYFTTSFLAYEMTLRTSDFHGMNFNINYTYSHGIDSLPVDYIAFDVWKTLKENSYADTRDRVNVMWLYNLPSSKGNTWYSYALRQWNLDAIGFFQSGLPFNVTESTNPTNGATGTNVPNEVADPHVRNQSAAEWFNPAAFQVQPNYTWGDAPIYGLYGPGNWDMDVAIHRTFSIRERAQAQFRLESFDMTNSRYPNPPNTELGTPGFSQITSYSNSRRLQGALVFQF